MEDQKDKAAETPDTAAQPTTDAAATAPEGAKGPEDKKVDLNRLIEEDGYIEKVLADKQAQPSDEPAVPEGTGAQEEPVKGKESSPKEQTIVLKNGDVEERIPLSQAQGRLNQAAHIQRIYQTEIAPIARVIRDNPLLSQALAEASRGDRTRLDAMLAIAGSQQQGTAAAGKPAAAPPDRLEKALKKLEGRPELEGWKPEEIKANMTVIAALQEALREDAPEGGSQAHLEEKFNADAMAIATESNKLKATLREVNPEGHEKTMEAVGQIVKEMYARVQSGEVKAEDFAYTMSLYNDPRQLDEQGRPLFLRLYRAGQERIAKSVVAPKVGGGVNARISPGAAASGAPQGSALPSLKDKSREERIALMDSFLGV